MGTGTMVRCSCCRREFEDYEINTCVCCAHVVCDDCSSISEEEYGRVCTDGCHAEEGASDGTQPVWEEEEDE